MSLRLKTQLVIFFALAPVASVALADDADSAPDTGQRIYEESCKSCHSGGIGGWFSGAPKTGDKELWAPLIEKGVPALIASSLNGFGEMKPRGGCDACTDSDITAAVEYMVEQSR